ncbi:MAG: lysophospholipid acyltransferase family protein, partial [Eubacteriales bacterium]|nr:lysophospholipid acyltransferase family protein [Eubacteriales bacterium]
MEKKNNTDFVEIDNKDFSLLYKVILNLYRVVGRLLFLVRVEGRENIPAGPCVLMGNHRAWLDPLSIAICVPERELRFMGKKELWKNGVFRWIAKQVRGIPVDRGTADMASIRTSMNVLKEGYSLGIFPEGTRTKGDEMLELHGGASLIALRSRCPVVPIYIDGEYKLFRPMVVRVGKPVEMDDLLAGRVNKDACDLLTARIAAAYADLSGGRSLP